MCFSHVAAQTAPKVTLSANTVSKCDFARATGPQGERPIRINLKVGEAYGFGEVYGQVLFDLRQNNKPTKSDDWFSGFQQALVATGLFSQDREYIFAVGAYANVPDGSGSIKRLDLGKQILYHFKNGPGGSMQLLTTTIQAGNRRVISTVDQEGLISAITTS
jgi:hypothetical protein